MPHRLPHDGRHERGENLLIDPRQIHAIVAEAASWPHDDLTEFAAGRGALTLPLVAAGLRVRAVEMHPTHARHLAGRVGGRAEVVNDDMLTHPVPRAGGVVSNVPFHLTTPWLRRLLAAPGWQRALLLLQWEVARKRAAVGGTTLLTAAWWPWFDFALLGRVPREAFRPRPSVDGGLLRMVRVADPPIAPAQRAAYQRMVTRAFTRPGPDIAATLAATPGRRSTARRLRAAGVDPRSRPRDLRRQDWLAAFHALTPPAPGTGG